jgi:hypothetical protein
MKAKVLNQDSEFIWMNEKLTMRVNLWRTKNLLYLQEALYASKHLKKVMVTDSMRKTLKMLNGAFQSNSSIKKIHIVITNYKRRHLMVAKLCQRKNLKATLVLKSYDHLHYAVKQLNNMDLDSGHGLKIDFKVKEDDNFEILLTTSKLSALEVQESKITQKLLETLKNHQSIRSLRFSSSALDTQESVSLAELLHCKDLTKLHLVNTQIAKQDLLTLENAINASTSLKSLTFKHSELELTAGIFMNTTLTKLKFGFINKSMACDLDGLAKNKTLQKLIYPPFSLKELIKPLQQNHTLKDLEVIILRRKSEASDIIPLIEASDSLQIIKFCYRTSIQSNLPGFPSIFWECCRTALRKNKVLTKIALCEDVQNTLVPVEVHPEVEELLRRNIEQRNWALQTRLFIRHMAARPQIYLSLLPLEVWALVLSFVNYPGLNMDFAQIAIESCY